LSTTTARWVIEWGLETSLLGLPFRLAIRGQAIDRSLVGHVFTERCARVWRRQCVFKVSRHVLRWRVDLGARAGSVAGLQRAQFVERARGVARVDVRADDPHDVPDQGIDDAPVDSLGSLV
jgi:hypothetical protein